MFGTNWQCIERKKMNNIFKQSNKFDPNLLGSQSFQLMNNSDTTISKKCSVLRKRRRNHEQNDIFSMDKVKKALRCFASTTDTQIIHGIHRIDIEPPQKKRRVNKQRSLQRTCNKS